jgi:hypothetical protein
MPRYSSYGSLDDRVQEDGDRSFSGFNNRLRPDQLEPGILADSQNGRMGTNGQWQVRKGVDTLLSPVASGVGALTLPFNLDDELTGAASVSSSELVITFGSAHGLGGTPTITLTDLSSATISPTTTVGNYTATVVNATTIKLTDKTYSSASGNIVIGGALLAGTPEINDDAVNQLYGACPFSNANVSSSEIDHYIVIAANSKAFAVNTKTEIAYDIGYESSQTISSSVNMIQAFNKVFIFRGDSVTLENPLKVGPITAVAKSGTNNLDLTVTTGHNHYLAIGDKVTITGISSSTISDSLINETQTVTAITDDTFKFTVDGTSTDPGTLTLTNAGFATPFTKVASGTYTQPTPIDVTNCDVSAGIATCTASSGDVDQLTVGDIVTISVVDTSPFTLGEEFTIASIPSSTTFTFITDQADVTNKSFLCTLPQSVAGGYSHMPAAEFGHYHQRRLVLPYKNKVAASTDTYTYRNIQDELIFSDILDSDTYDPIFNQFRFNAGKSDHIVGLHSFSEDVLMVFNRNSIHLVGDTTVIKDATNKLLTDEIGLIAKDSIQQIGRQVLFLSDSGVYGVEFIEDYKLRGTEVPLSQSIQSTIDRINPLHAHKAQAVYFDNRYYIAVPLDSESGQAATQNNAILVYNLLNQQWESIDTVNSPNFHITNMFVAGEEADRGVYTTNDIGGINQIEARDSGDDSVVLEVGGSESVIDVSGVATTRQFTLGTLDRKKWKSFEMHVESSALRQSNFDISAELENLDRTISVGSLSGFNNSSNLAEGEDISIRGRLGNPRAYGVQFTINNTLGRPKLRAVKTDGIESFRTVEKAD